MASSIDLIKFNNHFYDYAKVNGYMVYILEKYPVAVYGLLNGTRYLDELITIIPNAIYKYVPFTSYSKTMKLNIINKITPELFDGKYYYPADFTDKTNMIKSISDNLEEINGIMCYKMYIIVQQKNSVRFNYEQDGRYTFYYARDGYTLKQEGYTSLPIFYQEDNVLEGWYTDSNFTTEFTLDTVINSDIIAYPKWSNDGKATFFDITYSTPVGSINTGNQNIRLGNSETIIVSNFYKDPIGTYRTFLKNTETGSDFKSITEYTMTSGDRFYPSNQYYDIIYPKTNLVNSDNVFLLQNNVMIPSSIYPYNLEYTKNVNSPDSMQAIVTDFVDNSSGVDPNNGYDIGDYYNTYKFTIDNTKRNSNLIFNVITDAVLNSSLVEFSPSFDYPSMSERTIIGAKVYIDGKYDNEYILVKTNSGRYIDVVNEFNFTIEKGKTVTIELNLLYKCYYAESGTTSKTVLKYSIDNIYIYTPV